jgi:hypothetical protein
MCNDSEIGQEDGQWKGAGEPTEDALRTLARKADSTHSLDRSWWEQQIEQLGDQGLRVLPAAARDVDADKTELAARWASATATAPSWTARRRLAN